MNEKVFFGMKLHYIFVLKLKYVELKFIKRNVAGVSLWGMSLSIEKKLHKTGWTWTSHPNQGHESRLFQRHNMSPQFNCMLVVRPIVSNYHALFIIIHYTDIISYINHYKSPCWLVDSPNSQQFSTSLVSGHSLRFSASQISPQSLCSAPFGSQTDM